VPIGGLEFAALHLQAAVLCEGAGCQPPGGHIGAPAADGRRSDQLVRPTDWRSGFAAGRVIEAASASGAQQRCCWFGGARVRPWRLSAARLQIRSRYQGI